jgi:hypothetical protein
LEKTLSRNSEKNLPCLLVGSDDYLIILLFYIVSFIFYYLLGKTEEEANKYTGHWLRRQAVTTWAERGLTVPQMKAASGHHSESVLQGYIDSSEAIHHVAASALQSGVMTIPFVTPPPPPPTDTSSISSSGGGAVPSSSSFTSTTSDARVHYVISLNFAAN